MVKNISAQSVTFLRHITSLTSDLDSSSSSKSRTVILSWVMIRYNTVLSNPRLLYWRKAARVSRYLTPNVSNAPPQIGPRKVSVSGSCRITARVRSSLLSVAQWEGKSVFAGSFFTRFRQFSGSYWPQTATRGSQQPATRWYQEVKTTVTQGEGAVKPVLKHPYTRTGIKGIGWNIEEPTGDANKLLLYGDFEETDYNVCIQPRLFSWGH